MILEYDYVQTSHPKAGAGVKMKRDCYEQICEFILSTIDNEKELTINKLIEKANYCFWDRLKDETGRYIYYVKLDLEVRGLIQVQRCEQTRKTFIVRGSSARKRRRNVPQLDDWRTEPPTERLTQKLRSRFIEVFLKEPLIVSAPGVVRILGEHAEYNHGFVIQAVIDRGVLFAISRASEGETSICLINNEQQFIVDSRIAADVSAPQWVRVFAAILAQVKSRVPDLPAFQCMVCPDVPNTTSVDSCPAFSMGLVIALNMLFDLKLSVFQMARLAELSKSSADLRCGFIDRLTTVLARENHVMTVDCQRLTHNYYPLDLKEYCLLICDTHVSRPYAEREGEKRKERSEYGLSALKEKYPEIMTLKDVSIEQLIENIGVLPSEAFKCCQYIIEENRRVQKANKYLELCRVKNFGELLYQSHEGLRSLYGASTMEADFLVEQTRHIHGVLGSRLIGDGTTSRTLNIVHKRSVNLFKETIGSRYRHQFNDDISIAVVALGRGGSLLNMRS
jgi:galactokinase